MGDIALYAKNGEEVIPPATAAAFATMSGLAFAQPAIAAQTPAIPVDDTTPFFVGCPVQCLGGFYTVFAIVAGVSVTLTNTGGPFNVAPAAPVNPTGQRLWPVSFPGALQVGGGTLVAGTSGAIATAGTTSSVYSWIPISTSANAGNVRQTTGAATVTFTSDNVLDDRIFRWSLLSP